MKRKDWNLLVLAAAKGKPLTPVQLQKVLFLIGQNVRVRFRRGFYKFIHYDYGPFDAAVYQDAELLEMDGKACIMPVPGRRWSKYAATPEGLETAQQLRKRLPQWVVDYVDDLVEWARPLSFQDIVRAIYKAYPEYKVNSVFQE